MLDDRIEAYVDAVSDCLRLPLRAEHRPGVIANLRMILAQSEALVATPLHDAEEVAAVFRA
jgi:hypothetical protein